MKKNILIYPSGAGNAIALYYSIKDSIHINVIPATGKKDHSCLIYFNDIEYLPYIQSENFIEKLNDLITQKKIDFIFPTHDTIALFLAKKRNTINCQIINSNYKTNYLCRHKKETYAFFKNEKFCPKIYNDVLSDKGYPIIAKPNIGEGSKGVRLVNSKNEHSITLDLMEDLVYVEYLPGKEYTIDCFTNRNGELQFIGPRERVEIMMGVSFNCREVKNKKRFIEIANIINSRLDFTGMWFFQLKEASNGKLKLLEVSTRVPGTIGFYRHKGVNLPLLSVFDAMGFNLEIELNDFDVEMMRDLKDRYKYSFNYQRVYLDFDDTLVLNNKVNLDVISFVYQCKNLGKEVFLITRHEYDIKETLKKYNILESIFDEIIHINQDMEKSEFINPEKAIFIDNWYQERKKIKKLFNIPVFDVDAVNSLLIQ